MEIIRIVSGAITGAVAGTAWAIAGFGANKVGNAPEDFDGYKFARASLTGAFVGALLGASGSDVNPTDVGSYPYTFLLSIFADYLVKLGQRSLAKLRGK